MNYQREKKIMDKKKIIQDLLPDLLELISDKLDQIADNTKPAKKVATKKAAVKKKPVKKTPVKKTTTKKKPIKKVTSKLGKNKNAPREDFAGPNTYVDTLTDATELIALDKKICKKNKQVNNIPAEKMVVTKKCGQTTDEHGNIVNISGCGKSFESYGGGGYLCDECLTGMKHVTR